MEKNDLKEKLIIIGITLGIFLPIRLLFTSYISEHWLGSLGFVSAFAILLVVLIKKRKLGWFGRMFEKQMRKTINGKTGKFIVGFAIFFLVYFGGTLLFIERGDSIYSNDKEIFFLAIAEKGGYNIEDISTYNLIGPQIIEYTESENMQNIAKLDYMFSIAYAVMNDMSEGWLSHIVVVMFVEQIEVIGVLFFFRNTYKPITRVQAENRSDLLKKTKNE